jgi:hypothetical protein
MPDKMKEELVESLNGTYVGKVDGTILLKKHLEGEGWIGSEIRFSARLHDEPAFFRYRTFLTDSHLYTLSFWTYDREDLSRVEVDEFFSSFLIREEA